MFDNAILKLICSLPVIFLALCFMPAVGVCLIILRYFVYANRRYYSTSIGIIGLGIVILLPNIINSVLGAMKIENVNIPYLQNIISSDIYASLLSRSEFIITVGVVFLLISCVCKKLFNKLIDFIKSYIRNKEQMDREISKENDLKIKEKQERAKTTNVVRCPHCGAHNIISEKVGRCSFCRKEFENEAMNQK